MTSSKQKIKGKIQINAISISIILTIGLVLVAAFGIAGVVKGLFDKAPDVEEFNMIPEGSASVIYDADGYEIQKLSGADANRIYIKIDKIPEAVRNAFVAVEDPRFYEHHGIDIKGILRTVYTGVTKSEGFSQGEGTITQQLLKNQIFGGNNETSFLGRLTRKVQEQYLAVRLEDTKDKEQILEYYLNTINLGQDTVGVQAASMAYFDKNVEELTLSEAAVIAGITEDPSMYNPVTNSEENSERRKIVLKDMLDQNFIVEEDYEDALGDDVYTRIQVVNETKAAKGRKVNSSYVDAVVEDAIEDLKQELDYTQTQAYNAVYGSGLKIYSCQEQEVQNICDEVINTDSYYPKDISYYLSYQLILREEDGEKTLYNEYNVQSFFEGKKKPISLYFFSRAEARKKIKQFKKAMISSSAEIVSESFHLVKQPQSSFVLMEQSTGQVKAIVGGRGENNPKRIVNRATSTSRQPGSVFSTLSVYLSALDTSGMTLGTVLDDSIYYYQDTGRKVSNWNFPEYKGLTTLRDAISESVNVVAVKTLEQVTPQSGFDYLKNLGFTTLVDKKETTEGNVYSDIQLSTALGSLAEGVTNLELTAAYASIANNGVYTEPVFYTKIVDSNGNVLINKKPQTKQVMKKSTAWLLTDALMDGMQQETDKVDLQLQKAGKAGTTFNYSDFWFEGYTPYYTAGIWCGFDQSKKQKTGNYHKVMWKKIMKKVHDVKELKKGVFQRPEDINTCQICAKCGKLAVKGLCDKAWSGNCVQTEYFAKGSEPAESCDCHVKYTLCKASGELATQNCPKKDLLERIYLIKNEVGKTTDSPYVLPKGFSENYCRIH